MRSVHLSDLDVATRVLLGQSDKCWSVLAADMVARAGVADRFRQRLSRAHPQFGTGTLQSAARSFGIPVNAPRADADYRRALKEVLRSLTANHKVA